MQPADCAHLADLLLEQTPDAVAVLALPELRLQRFNRRFAELAAGARPGDPLETALPQAADLAAAARATLAAGQPLPAYTRAEPRLLPLGTEAVVLIWPWPQADVDEELERFVRAAVHDLKEPLRAVAGFATLLEQRLADSLEPRAREYLTLMRQGVTRMQRLIDGMQEFAHLAAVAPVLAPVELDLVMERVQRQLRAALAGADLECEPLPTVRGDPRLLEYVLHQLLDNALKFRGEQTPRIRVWAERNGPYWRIAVRDNGLGVDTAQQARLFQPFVRLHKDMDIAGSGLGLALVKRIIERHGGRVGVASAKGEGATFYVELPAALEG